ncbi:MAG: DciA family protein [Bradymonadaceae bacterium]
MRQILKHILEQSAEQADDWHPPVGVLREAWPGLVGDELAAVSRPAAVDWQQGRLILEAASEAWQRELRRHDDELLDRLTQVLPWRLETLEVRSGMLTDTDRSPDEPSAMETDSRGVHPDDGPGPTADPVETPEDVDTSLSSLGDETAGSARRILEHIREEEE